VKVKEMNQVKISYTFAALENLDDDDDDDVDISRAGKSIRENMKASAIESLGYYVRKEVEL
jgi:hypothetical protein